MSLRGRKWPPRGTADPRFFSSFSPSLHGDRAQIASRQRRWSLQMLDFGIISFRPVAWEKINKEYVYKYKYIRRRQNVSDRAVNDNAAGGPCGSVCLSLWKAMTSIPPDISPPPIPALHSNGGRVCVCFCLCVCVCVLLLYKKLTQHALER